MDDTPPLHTIQSIVTPDSSEYGVGRMRVVGGRLYWLSPVPGCMVSSFVPDQASTGTVHMDVTS